MIQRSKINFMCYHWYCFSTVVFHVNFISIQSNFNKLRYVRNLGNDFTEMSNVVPSSSTKLLKFHKEKGWYFV